ncbi:MAG: hypothetical protein ABUT39_29555 [Acidobacteriota bacterium]
MTGQTTLQTGRRGLGLLLAVLSTILLERFLDLGPRTVLALGTFGKLLFLVVATIVAAGNVGKFEPGTPTRTAWRMLAAGFGALSIGQALIAVYQFAYGVEVPFPSIVDVFFVASYPLMIAALLKFLRAYTASGFPIGPSSERVWLSAGVTVVCAAIGYFILKPVVTTPAPPLETLLNVVYPVMDFLLLVPTALLIRISLHFRGGAVWKVWATLLGGLVFLCAADALFAWFSQLHRTDLVDLVDLTYLLSYGCFALGVLYQRQLLTE